MPIDANKTKPLAGAWVSSKRSSSFSGWRARASPAARNGRIEWEEWRRAWRGIEKMGSNPLGSDHFPFRDVIHPPVTPLPAILCIRVYEAAEGGSRGCIQEGGGREGGRRHRLVDAWYSYWITEAARHGREEERSREVTVPGVWSTGLQTLFPLTIRRKLPLHQLDSAKD